MQRPCLEHGSFGPVSGDPKLPAVIPKTRELPGPQRSERVLLGLQSLQDEDDSAVRSPNGCDCGTPILITASGGRSTCSATYSLTAISRASPRAIHGETSRPPRLAPLGAAKWRVLMTGARCIGRVASATPSAIVMCAWQIVAFPASQRAERC